MDMESIINKVLFGIFLVLCGINLMAEQVVEDFADFGANSPLQAVGNVEGLVAGHGQTVYQTAKLPATAFRWLGLNSEVIDGDFTAEFAFTIRQLDQWNSIDMQVAAVDKKFSVVLGRRQLQAGNHVLVLEYTLDGKKQSFSLPESGTIGTLKLTRTGEKFRFFWQAGDGTAKEVFTSVSLAGGPVTASIAFGTAPATHATIELRKFALTWNKRVPQHLFPLYLPHRKVAEAVPLYREQATKNADGSWNIAPGGRMILAAQCRPVSRAWMLRWHSQGELKIKCIMPGSAETLQLSDTVQWDAAATPETKKYQERSVGLESWMLRFPNERNWPLAHVTIHGVFFFEVSPVGNQAIRFGVPELWAQELKAPEPFRTAAAVAATGQEKGPYTLLAWSAPESPAGTLAGIPKTMASNNGNLEIAR